MKRLMNFLRDEEGATAIEYGLVAAFIAAAVAVTVGLVGDRVDAIFEDVLDKIGG